MSIAFVVDPNFSIFQSLFLIHPSFYFSSRVQRIQGIRIKVGHGIKRNAQRSIAINEGIKEYKFERQTHKLFWALWIYLSSNIRASISTNTSKTKQTSRLS